MDREVNAMGYGICIFSADTVQDFLKREKIRKRKLLSLLQKDKELYLSTQKEGILIALVGINAYNYAIRLEGRDEPFDDRWVQKKTLKKLCPYEKSVINDIIFYVIYVITVREVNSLKITQKDICNIDIHSINNNKILNAANFVFKEYQRLGGNGKVAKGANLISELNTLLSHELKETI